MKVFSGTGTKLLATTRYWRYQQLLHKNYTSSQILAAAPKPEDEPAVIPVGEVKRFIIDCMHKLNTPKSHCEQLANVLVAADYRGHFSHGLNRLGILFIIIPSSMYMYCKIVQLGIKYFLPSY